jgi:hypothetical protein
MALPVVNQTDMRDALRGAPDLTVTGSFGDDMLARDLFEQGASAPPDLPPEPAALPLLKPGIYRFRTKPGHRMTSIKLRIYRELDDEKKNDDGKKRFERWAARLYGDGDIRKGLKALELDRKVHERTGEYYIQFTPNKDNDKREGYFETGDALVASYIRSRISEWPYIYEEIAPMQVLLADGSTATVVPADDESRARMAAVAAGA